MSPPLEQAMIALRSRRLEDAARLANSVLRADRGNLLAVEILGTALLALDRPVDALVPLQRSAKRSGDPAIETLAAKALLASGRTQEALAQLQLTTERRPPYPPAFLELGEALAASGRFEEAADVLGQALNLMPTADGLRIALGYVHLKRNDRGGARRAFQHVRTAAPGRRDAMIAMAKLMALEGQYADAADLYRQALAKQPDDPPSRISLGKCLLELDRREEGEAVIRQAIQAAPQFAGLAVGALASASHGRFFLRPSAALKFFERDAAAAALRP